MCYDISFSTSIELVTKYLPELDPSHARELDLIFTPNAHFLGQAFPKLPVIVLEDEQLRIKAMEWGVVAPYMNTPESIKKNRSWMLNARSEKLLDKKAFWGRIRNRRCIVPANGFFEHREVKGVKTKVPYFIHRNDQEAIFLGGVFHQSVVPDTGEVVDTFAIITRPANPLMERIHNGGENSCRMPLQFQNDMVLAWLKADIEEQELQSFLDYEFPVAQMEAWPVFTIRGRSGRPDGKEKNEPFEHAGLPGIYEEPVLKTNLLF